jgi:hypothetical protein
MRAAGVAYPLLTADPLPTLHHNWLSDLYPDLQASVARPDSFAYQIVCLNFEFNKRLRCLLSIKPSGMVANTYLNMDLLNARSRTFSAAICAQMRGDSAHTSFFHPQHENPGTTKESYHNIHAQSYLDLAQITTIA